MLFVVALFLTIIGGVFLILGRTPPRFVAVPSLLCGGLIIVSRILAWTSGAAQHGYLVASSEGLGIKGRMIIMELLFWALGIVNVWIFAARFFE